LTYFSLIMKSGTNMTKRSPHLSWIQKIFIHIVYMEYLNLYFFLKLKEIGFKFKKPSVILLPRPYNSELEWYMSRL
jgi:hypothetical protein